ncbi:MAG TPA: flagellar FleN [Azoarcus sp.]|nr:flagellar FleN [Azoarcus sp.]
MIDAHEDQATGLRRLFRRAPPLVVALYAAGRERAAVALRTAYRFSARDERVLVLDEAGAGRSLAQTVGVEDNKDLLGVLGERIRLDEIVQRVPGLAGRVPARAAALALPLLDGERREKLCAALDTLHRRTDVVLVHADGDEATDPSPFVFAAPHRLLVAETSRSGALEAYATIKALAAAGAGSLHVAVAGARSREEATAFFASLDALVFAHVGVPLTWLGEIESDDLRAGLASNPVPRQVGMPAFLRRLATPRDARVR